MKIIASTNVNLHQAVKLLGIDSKLDILDIKLPGKGHACLLRGKEIPELAFLVDPNSLRESGISLRGNEDYSYPIDGIPPIRIGFTSLGGKYEGDKNTKLGYDAYGFVRLRINPDRAHDAKKFIQSFRKAISTCARHNGIRVVFVNEPTHTNYVCGKKRESVYLWSDSEIQYIELAKSWNRMTEDYGRNVIWEALSFIDIEKSGMGFTFH